MWCFSCGAAPVVLEHEAEAHGHFAPSSHRASPAKKPGAALKQSACSIEAGSGISTVVRESPNLNGASQDANDALLKVCLLLRSCSELRGSPIDQLQGAAWLLADALDLGLVSVSMLMEGSQPCNVCIAAAGSEAAHANLGLPVGLCLVDQVDRTTLAMPAASRVLRTQEGYMRVILPSQPLPPDMPADWLDLYHATGLAAFASVPVIRSGKAMGTLTVASTSASSWASSSVLGLLSAVSAWLSQLFDTPQLSKLPSLLANTLMASDVESMTQALGVGLQEHFKAFLRLKLHARIAILSTASNAAIVYEQQTGSPVKHASRTHQHHLPMGGSADACTTSCNGGTGAELRAKLNAIRKSTAMSSQQDFIALTTAISANDNTRDMFARESASVLGMPMPGSPSSHAAVLGSSPPSYSMMGMMGLAGASFTHTSRPNNLGTSHQSTPQLTSPFGSGRLNTAGIDIPNANDGGESTPVRGAFAPGTVVGSLPTLGKASTSLLARPSSMANLYDSPGNSISMDAAQMTDVVLRLVDEVPEHEQGPMCMVAHTVASLDKTLLEAVLAQEGQQRGTWISDITTYMMQPNRPGKDIALSSSSPAIASLALACMPTTNVSVVQLTGKHSSLSSIDMPLGSMTMTMDRYDSTEAPPLMAVYLTSATTLSALQLNAVLKELHMVLNLLCVPLTERLRSCLHTSLSALMSGMLDEVEVPAITSNISMAGHSHSLGSSSQRGKANSSFMNAGNGKSKLSALHTAMSPKSYSSFGGGSALIASVLGRASGTDNGGYAGHMDGGGSPFSIGNNMGMPIARTRSQTWYSKEPIKPQVAPLVAGLQDRLRGLQAESAEHICCFNRHEDLKTVRAEILVAHGGFGSVFQGLWQGLEVAIKVVPQRADHTDSVREAVELAVMSTVSHPNILGVQNYWTDVLVMGGPLLPGERRSNGLLKLESGTEREAGLLSLNSPSSCNSTSALLSPRLSGSRLQHSNSTLNDKDNDAKRSLVIIMELCDQGSLDDAIQRGAFRIQTRSTPRLNMLAVLTTLLEIAMALRHMHGMQLVHCDLKPGNVLLKSSMSDIRQFTTKLCDFGLVKIRQEATDLTEVIRRSTFTGTVTHSPPEMLRGDPNPAFSYDIFAFGIIMWELTATVPVYAGLSDRQVAQQVVYNNLRPEFPKNFDANYKELAAACWAADPSHRPTSDQVVTRIGALLMAIREKAAAAASVAGVTPHHAQLSAVSSSALNRT